MKKMKHTQSFLAFGIIISLLFSACRHEEVRCCYEGENSGKSILEMDISEVIIPEEEKLKYDMGQRLEIYRAWVRDDPQMIDETPNYPDSMKFIVLYNLNMWIRDIITGELVTDVYDRSDDADKTKFAMYTLSLLNGPSDFLLYNNGAFTVFNVSDYSGALKEISAYFERNENVDECFFPLCVQEITKLYVMNRLRYSDYGPWRHWMGEEADSLGLIYNKLLNFR